MVELKKLKKEEKELKKLKESVPNMSWKQIEVKNCAIVFQKLKVYSNLIYSNLKKGFMVERNECG